MIEVGTLVKEMNDLNVNVPKVSRYRYRGVQVSYSCCSIQCRLGICSYYAILLLCIEVLKSQLS